MNMSCTIRKIVLLTNGNSFLLLLNILLLIVLGQECSIQDF